MECLLLPGCHPLDLATASTKTQETITNSQDGDGEARAQTVKCGMIRGRSDVIMKEAAALP